MVLNYSEAKWPKNDRFRLNVKALLCAKNYVAELMMYVKGLHN